MVLLFFGVLHFAQRDHGQDERSYFLGGIRLGHAVRLVFAAIEMLAGAALLLL
jgi:hypothetical protein